MLMSTCSSVKGFPPAQSTASLSYIILFFLFLFFSFIMQSPTAPSAWLRDPYIQALVPGTPTSYFVFRNAKRGVFCFESLKQECFFFLFFLLVHCSNSLFRFFVMFVF